MRLSTLAGALALLLLAASAHATTISFSPPSSTPASARAAEAMFLAGLPGYAMESFEGVVLPGAPGGPGHDGGLVQASFSTPVGTFAQTAPPPHLTGDQCVPSCGNGLAVLSRATSPFDGRFAITPGGQWLDSNDAARMRFTLTSPRRAVGFYLTDINDIGGRLTITALGGSPASLTFFGSYGSRVYTYVWMSDPAGIPAIDFTMAGSVNDGFGIDQVSVADPVPEPGTLLLLGGGLFGLGSRLRRRQR